MHAHAVRHLSVTICTPFERAYAFAHVPDNFPRWAAGLSTTLRHTDQGWIADTPEGEARVTFSEPNAYGVLDHTVELAGRAAIHIPLRLIRNGDATEVVLTLYRQPDMDDAAFERDTGLVMRDLHALKALLEA